MGAERKRRRRELGIAGEPGKRGYREHRGTGKRGAPGNRGRREPGAMGERETGSDGRWENGKPGAPGGGRSRKRGKRGLGAPGDLESGGAGAGRIGKAGRWKLWGNGKPGAPAASRHREAAGERGAPGATAMGTGSSGEPRRWEHRRAAGGAAPGRGVAQHSLLWAGRAEKGCGGGASPVPAECREGARNGPTPRRKKIAMVKPPSSHPGVDFKMKTIEVDGIKVRIQIW